MRPNWPTRNWPSSCRRIRPVFRPDVDAAGVHERINLLMWIDRCWVAEHFAEHLEKLKAIRLEWFMLYHNVGTISSRPFYLPWMAFREYGDWCDSLGNCLAILTGVADGHRTRAHPALHEAGGHGRALPHQGHLPAHLPRRRRLARLLPQPQPQSAPPVPQRRHLAHDRRFPRGCAGGPRPAGGGGRAAAFPGRGQPCRVENQDWGFNEWLHGRSGHAMGYDQQAWSAAMYLYADNAVRNRTLPLFDQLLAAKPASPSPRRTTLSSFSAAAARDKEDLPRNIR